METVLFLKSLTGLYVGVNNGRSVERMVQESLLCSVLFVPTIHSRMLVISACLGVNAVREKVFGR